MTPEHSGSSASATTKSEMSRSGATRSGITKWWRWVVGWGLLALILIYADPKQIWAAWTGISWHWFIPAAALFGLAHLSLAEGLRISLAALKVEVQRGQIAATHFEALFVGSFLPSSLGADVFKVIDLGRRTRRWIHIGLGVAAQRAVALVMVLGTLAVTLPAAVELDVDRLTHRLVGLWPWLVAVAVVLAVTTPFLLTSTRREGLVRQLREALGALGQMGVGPLIALIAFQAIALGLNIVGCFWVSRSLGLQVDWIHFCYLMPATYLAIALPVTVSGLGVREGVYVTLLGAQGIAPSRAVALSLTIFSLSIFYACVGAAVHMLRSDPTDLSRAAASPGDASESDRRADAPESEAVTSDPSTPPSSSGS